jgi:hypothetical protein
MTAAIRMAVHAPSLASRSGPRALAPRVMAGLIPKPFWVEELQPCLRPSWKSRKGVRVPPTTSLPRNILF